MTKKPERKISADGTKEWFLNGERHRVDGPAVEWVDGTKEWWLNGEPHRVDGPAIEWSGGSKEWFLNGKLHRVDGPAVEWSDGSKAWWLNGEQFDSEVYWSKMFEARPVGTIVAGDWGSCLKLSPTSFLLHDFAKNSLTLLEGA